MNKDENNTKTKEKNLADKANSVAKLENVNESETTAEKLKKESERKEPIKGSKRFFNIIDKLGDLFFLNIYFVEYTHLILLTLKIKIILEKYKPKSSKQTHSFSFFPPIYSV